MQEGKRIGGTCFKVDSFRKYEVKDCSSVREFLDKYFNVRDIYRNSSLEEYIQRLEKEYSYVMKRNGLILLISVDSKTGSMVSFYKDQIK